MQWRKDIEDAWRMECIDSYGDSDSDDEEDESNSG